MHGEVSKRGMRYLLCFCRLAACWYFISNLIKVYIFVFEISSYLPN